jgi:hypothetical protein
MNLWMVAACTVRLKAACAAMAGYREPDSVRQRVKTTPTHAIRKMATAAETKRR